MKIGIASDHHGVNKKRKLIDYLTKQGYEVEDFGPFDINSVDYPEYAFKVSKKVASHEMDLGILMCGTGIGMSIAANKVKGIRCARIATVDDARLSKEHNHANIIAFSANNTLIKIKRMVKKFIDTQESTEERHIRRVNMIDNYHD